MTHAATARVTFPTMDDLIMADARSRNAACKLLTLAFHAHRLLRLTIDDLLGMVMALRHVTLHDDTTTGPWSPLTYRDTRDMLDATIGAITVCETLPQAESMLEMRLGINLQDPLLKACIRSGICPGASVKFVRVARGERTDTVDVISVELGENEPIFFYLNEFGNLRWALFSTILSSTTQGA